MEPTSLPDLLAHQAIAAVRYRFAQCLDEQDFDTLLSLFAEQVEADFTDFGAPAQTVPPQALVANFRHNLSRPGLRTQHLCTNFRIALAGDQATSTLQWVGHHFLAGAEGGEEFTLRAEYTDHLTRTNGGWLITGLTARLRFTTGNPGLLAG